METSNHYITGTALSDHICKDIKNFSLIFDKNIFLSLTCIPVIFSVKSKTQDVTKVFKSDEINITDKNEITSNFCSYFCSINHKLRNVSAWRFNMVSHETLKDQVSTNNAIFKVRSIQPIEAFNELRQIKRGIVKRLIMTKFRQI